METENILIARICHDLITPCNAINLGIEAFEMAEDRELITCIKDSATKANSLLKFMRELFSTKDVDFFYTKSFIETQSSDFLKIYNIDFKLASVGANIVYGSGKVILHTVAILKEIMPFGGQASCRVDDNLINFTYGGKGISELDINIPSELNYKNILKFKLLEQLKEQKFSIMSSLDGEKGIINEIKR